MPYLASNQDANNQEGFKSAMMAAGVVFGAAALGAGYLSGKLPKMGGVKDGKGVAKQLYKSNAKNLSKDVAGNLGVRTAQDIADGGMTKYAIGKSWTGKERVYSKNDSLIGRFKDNHLNKDVRAFNKTIRDYKKGNFGNDVYGKSKATLYQDLYDKTQASGIGLTSKDLTKVTNGIHNEKVNVAKRAAQNWSDADDIRLTNDIWGGADYKGTTAKDRVNDFFTKDIDDAILDRNAELGKKAMADREAADIAKMNEASRKSAESKAIADRKIRNDRAKASATNVDELANKQPGSILERQATRKERAALKDRSSDAMTDPNRAGRFYRAQQDVNAKKAAEQRYSAKNEANAKYRSDQAKRAERQALKSNNVDRLANKQPNEVLMAQTRQPASAPTSNTQRKAQNVPGSEDFNKLQHDLEYIRSVQELAKSERL